MNCKIPNKLTRLEELICEIYAVELKNKTEKRHYKINREYLEDMEWKHPAEKSGESMP